MRMRRSPTTSPRAAAAAARSILLAPPPEDVLRHSVLTPRDPGSGSGAWPLLGRRTGAAGASRPRVRPGGLVWWRTPGRARAKDPGC
jgi:hypothetical protein